MMREARLILEDGTEFRGWSFGYEQNAVGEVVFNTAMTGYPESLTDPSYAGQILTFTYPLIGNYGVPETGGDALPFFMESDRIHPKAIVVADYSEKYSHWNAKTSLSEWLKREQVPAITGIDTRRLTKVLREHGVMMGRIVVDAAATPLPCRGGVGGGVSDFTADDLTLQTPPLTPPLEGRGMAAPEDYGSVNWVEKVSCKDVIRYNEGAGKKVVLVDCGVKANIIRCLIRRGVEVIRVPWNYDYTGIDFDGLFLANGPGDPDTCVDAVDILRKQMSMSRKPICGICMGNQLLAKAGGATVYKLKYGHRSHNQPVREVGTNCCYVTSQNHGYAVDTATLGSDWRELFVNMNDGSNEGIRHMVNPWFSSQFHPEACSGPTDTEFMFDRFISALV